MKILLKQLQKEIYINAKEHGFWKGEVKNIPTKLCLIHSEISEALEAFRNNKITRSMDNWIGEELADAIIRILDLAEFLNIDMEYEIKRKHKINLNRPYKHGKKKF